SETPGLLKNRDISGRTVNLIINLNRLLMVSQLSRGKFTTRDFVKKCKPNETVAEQSKDLEAIVRLIEASHIKKLHELKTTFE
ncbi:2630_t:CDS:2, partial [Racocetra fulgida]